MPRPHRRHRRGDHRWIGLALSGYLAVTAVAVAGGGSWFAWTTVRDGKLLSALGAGAMLTAAAGFTWLSRWLIGQWREPSPCGHEHPRPDEFESFAVVGGMLDGAVYTRSSRRRWPGRAGVVFVACCILLMLVLGVSQSHWGGVAAALVMAPCWLIVSLYVVFGTAYVPVIDEGVATVIGELEQAYGSDGGHGE